MAKVKHISGVDKIVQQLQKKIKQTKGLNIGVLRAGLFLQRESMKLVPVEFGVLRNSANTRQVSTSRGSEVIVSYGTDYAVFVHENLEAHHPGKHSKFQGGSGRQAKFLEEPARTKRNEMKKIIRKAIKKELR